MKAARLAHPAGLDSIQLVDIEPAGEPGPGEIRVQVQASSLNYHDYAVVLGRLPTQDGRILLSDAAGVVEAVGPGVGAGADGFAVGDRVVSCFFPNWQDGPPPLADFSQSPGDGIDGYARECVVAPATAFTRAPAGWSALEAATITVAGLTAWRALVVDAGVKAGDTVLVLGTGGVSIYALQLAHAMGARVIATSSSDAKLERAHALGAEHTINYRTTPDWATRVLELTGGRGVDITVEVGGPGTLPQSIRATRIGGHIALIGVLTGRAGEVPTSLLMARQQRLQGLVVGHRRNQLDFVRALEVTGIRPVIDSRFPLARLADAFRHEAAGAHFGKIGIEL